MSDIRKPKTKDRPKKRLSLQRGADGRLYSADSKDAHNDIGDLWAEQKRIRLAQAIEEDQKKYKRKELRKKRGLVGVAKKDLSGLTSKMKTELFGEEAINKPKLPKNSRQPQQEVTQTVEIKISMPSHLPKIPKVHPIAELKKLISKLSKKTIIISGSIAAAAIIGLAGFHMLSAHSKKVAFQRAAAKAAAAEKASSGLTPGTPDFPTVLPAGKTIQSLGGWYRVSPQNRDPVYAFGDKVSGVVVDVSEQPLPANFQNDTSDQVAQLAKSFSANQTLMAGGTTVYVGTSAKGPQSLILTKNNLLILIKSATLIPNKQWSDYVQSLQ